MINVSGIDHLVLRVGDLDAALRFYGDVLGCRLERESSELGLYQLRAGRALIDLVTVDGQLGREGGRAPARDDAHNLDHLCLRVEPFDADAIFARLDRAGVEHGPVEIRYGAEGSGPSIYCRDPAGNTVELKGPPR